MSSLELIRILCIKLGTFDQLPRWRILRKRKIEKQIVSLYDEFLKHDIFDKASAITAIVSQYYVNTPEIIPDELRNILDAGAAYIKIYLDTEDPYTGTVFYSSKLNQFSIDIVKDDEQYIFDYSESLHLNKFMQEIFDNISIILDEKFFMIIEQIADMINYPGFNPNQEFVND